MTNKSELGKRIRLYRQSRNMSQARLAEIIGKSVGAIGMYETGKREPDLDTVEALADAFNVSMRDMMPDGDSEETAKNVIRISARTRHRIPLIGSAAAGEPVYNEEVDVYIDGPLKADCAIRVQGDSMEPTFLDGDILYIREQPDIDYEGQIAVVIIGDEACVKHVYRQKESLLLISDNTKYAPMVKLLGEGERVRILGRIIGYTRMFKE